MHKTNYTKFLFIRHSIFFLTGNNDEYFRDKLIAVVRHRRLKIKSKQTRV